MKILRSMKRRDFSVEPAGYFNVLRPSKRFSNPHPAGRFGYLPGQPKAPLGSENTAAPTFASASVLDQKYLDERDLRRPALIVLAAITLTLFFVWWSAGCPIRMIF